MIKLRTLRSELRAAGCEIRHIRGSHETWGHPQQGGRVVVAGKNGEVAQRYQVRKVRKFLRGMVVYSHL